MSASDPAANAGAAPEIRLTVEGTLFDPDRLVSVETWSEANRIPRARLVFFEGQGDDGKDFPLSAGKGLLPGRKIMISAGYGGVVEPIHSGLIVRHAIRVDPGSSPQLVIETADPLVKMTLSRGSAITEEKSDKDLIAALVAAAGGAVGKNEASAAPHESFVRYHASAWDTIVMRAEASGCLAFVEAGKVDIVAPGGGTPVVALEYGDDVIALEAVLDATAPVSESGTKSRSWSYAQQALGEGAASGATPAAPGNFGADDLAKALGLDAFEQRSGAAIDDARLADWSKAALMRGRLAAVRGTLRFHGSAAVKPGTLISLNGVGPRFEGDAFVTAVGHVYRGGVWQTSAGFGMAKESFAAAAADVAPPAAAGLVPPIRGLHTGQVTKVAPDPAGDYRAQVTLPLIGDENGVWARLAGFYASSGFGAVFWPEVGDEVVLGFMDEDPSHPVILGSLYSNQRKPDETKAPAEANDLKAIVSRTKLEISFDDKDTVLTVKTPGGRIVKLDDTKGEIEISDSEGNKILMDKDKVSIASAAELKLESKTNLSITSGAKLTIEAKTAYALSAASIEEKAKSMLTIESKGTGEIKTAAPLTIQGALVKIN
jgi:phage protein D